MLAGSMEGSADSRGRHHSAPVTEEYHLETDFNNLHLPTFVSLASFFYFSETLVGHPLDVVRTRIQVDRTVSIPSLSPDRRIFCYEYDENTIRFKSNPPQIAPNAPLIYQRFTFRHLRQMLGHLGARGLYVGFWPTALGHLPGNGAYLVTYSYLKDHLQKLDNSYRDRHGIAHSPGKQVAWVSFVSAAVADAIACVCYCPVELVVQRMVIQDSHTRIYKNSFNAVKAIWKDDGVRGFYRGFGAYLCNYVPATAMWWMSYEHFKHIISKFMSRRESKNSGVVVVEHHRTAHFLAGAVAGVLTAVVTNPMDVVRTRLQTQHHHAELTTKDIKLYKNTFEAIPDMWRNEGLKAFTKGLLPRTISWTLLSSVHAFLYEFLVKASTK